jgi:hypothetical protein
MALLRSIELRLALDISSDISKRIKRGCGNFSMIDKQIFWPPGAILIVLNVSF